MICLIILGNKNKVLSPEKRILMSSILYLAFPRLIQKLDYCLEEPVSDQTCKYNVGLILEKSFWGKV